VEKEVQLVVLDLSKCLIQFYPLRSCSLHPSGNVLATGGLDCCVNIWDVRKINSSTTAPIVKQHNSKSINSAFFSPNGMHLLTTTMADTLDIINDSHLMKGIIAKPDHRIRHNNRTGRWLSTFMAQWHPSASTDLFVVGSMMHPRTLQIFDASRGEVVRDVQGESLTAVVSRCCFHPSEQKLISAGGNSSGRVTVTR
jgi:WD40 repeat protein